MSSTTDQVRPVSGRFSAAVLIAAVGLHTGLLAPNGLLVARHLEQIDPAGKVAALGWVVAAGSLVASVIAPIAGVLSDRTRSSWGRRRPWVVGSAAVAALSLVLLAYQTEIWLVLVLCCVAQAALAVLLSALSALIPDQVPVNQRGRISALLGLAQPLGAMLATVLVTAIFADVFDGYLILAAVLAGATALFAVLVDEPPVTTAQTGKRVSVLDGLRFSALADRDFALSWVGRFLVMLGTTAAVLYFLYYLSDELRYQEISGEPAEAGMLWLTVVFGMCCIVGALVGGSWSDRVGRRKPFVAASGVTMAAGCLLLGAVLHWPSTIAGAALLGVGFGVYTSAATAHITQVLPSRGNGARDLAVVSASNTIAQVLAPLMAAPVIALAGSYRALYVLAGVLALGGTLLSLPVRGAR
nr:MFS transporter [Kibdelosporangium sp. MJ126-NF4]CEL16236.1 major facilitator superfamily MFS_1 [Kibdelosporangium sp. MJ126-NF4]CTQ94161.1 major facilitator superfamily MFS_1 [Kibdelosporangium sp. MJ126-NF4]